MAVNLANLDKTLSLRREIQYKTMGVPLLADIWHEKLIITFLRERLPQINIISEESYKGELYL